MGKILTWSSFLAIVDPSGTGVLQNNFGGVYPDMKNTPNRCPTYSVLYSLMITNGGNNIIPLTNPIKITGSYSDNQLVQGIDIVEDIPAAKSVTFVNSSGGTMSYKLSSGESNTFSSKVTLSLTSGATCDISASGYDIVSVDSGNIISGEFAYSDVSDGDTYELTVRKTVTIVNNASSTQALVITGAAATSINPSDSKTITLDGYQSKSLNFTCVTQFKLNGAGVSENDGKLTYSISWDDITNNGTITATKYESGVTYYDLTLQNGLDDEIFYKEVSSLGNESNQKYINQGSSDTVRFYKNGQLKISTNTLQDVQVSINTDHGYNIFTGYLSNTFTTIDISANDFDSYLAYASSVTIEAS